MSPSDQHTENHYKRGANIRPANRFETTFLEKDWEQLLEEDLKADLEKPLTTNFIIDRSKTILTKNSSPDIPFEYSANIYRGCEHGCSYCYARPTHETLGFDGGIGFETNILVKENAPELLRAALQKKSWKKQGIVFSGVTDCYQPAERRFKLMRQCLEVLLEFQNPVSIITKNILILRDLDLIKQFADQNLIRVFISITSLNDKLISVMEPRTAVPQARLHTVKALSSVGVPVGVMVSPIIPGLNDQEIPDILKACAAAGAKSAGYVLLRLPLSVKPVFLSWLQQHFPERYDRVTALIENCREGELNQTSFGVRMRGTGAYAMNLAQTFKIFSKKFGINSR